MWRRRISWAALLPPSAAVAIALTPAPESLALHGWFFFAVFVGVIVGLIAEPLPAPAISLIGVILVTALAPWVLFSAADLRAPGFEPTSAALSWALSGFSNSTVWLIVGAFTFALGYEKTGLGRRLALVLVRALGRRTVTVAYAIVVADTVLAPVTPSSTARTAGTLYPVVRSLPPLYGSMPDEPSSRVVGSYLMWTALASGAITNSMFLTGMAPNLLAVELVLKTVGVQIRWMDWFLAFAPAGTVLLLTLPWLVYRLYPPITRESSDVAAWAHEQLRALGPTTWREAVLGGLVLLGLSLWIFGGDYVNATTAALVVVVLMLVSGVVSWDDILTNKQGWSTLVWFATLIALADGLNRTGFVAWFGTSVGRSVAGLTPTIGLIILATAYFFSHYFFASVTAHTAAVLPIMLAVGAAIPGMPVRRLSLILVLCGGIMGILTPYAGGPNPVYYGSGYLPARDFWRLGAIFGFLFFTVWMSFGLWLLPVE